jgi:hypothetical protein
VRREHTPALLELVDHLGLELDADVQAENTHGVCVRRAVHSASARKSQSESLGTRHLQYLNQV